MNELTKSAFRPLFFSHFLLFLFNHIFHIAVPSGAVNEPDICFTWRSHVKTFDGRYFYFPGRCTYKLIHDCQDDLFSVHVFTDPQCKDLKNCRRAVNLYLGGLDIKVILNGNVRLVVQWSSIPGLCHFAVFLDRKVCFTFNYFTPRVNYKGSMKDSVPEKLRSRIVYNCFYASCNASYVGEIDRHFQHPFSLRTAPLRFS